MATRRHPTHNTAAIRQLAGMLASKRFEFDMGDWNGAVKPQPGTKKFNNGPACGTAGCIGGHAGLLWANTRREQCVDTDGGLTGAKGAWYYSPDTRKTAAKLGLDDGETHALFVPNGLESVTRCMAVGALQRLAESGKIEFTMADREGVALHPDVRAWAEWFDATPESITVLGGCERAPEDVPALKHARLALTPEVLVDTRSAKPKEPA